MQHRVSANAAQSVECSTECRMQQRSVNAAQRSANATQSVSERSTEVSECNTEVSECSRGRRMQHRVSVNAAQRSVNAAQSVSECSREVGECNTEVGECSTEVSECSTEVSECSRGQRTQHRVSVNVAEVELLIGHCEAPQVPAYPEEQAEEGQQRSGQDEKVPETEGCEDPDEEQDEADDVKNQSQSKEEGGALSILHGRRPLYVD
ncbi:hypothetical protein D5F01_LYC24710 [Larimichthys crocea]|uniref:Uncharacterized protein n=1 Tax=Larimichthys crocea TaxID=215358 RepID=A0A6G0HDV5_LARCR|nr:hypothetical protein D5F01_LYC24710 [Larimichthys crocea]